MVIRDENLHFVIQRFMVITFILKRAHTALNAKFDLGFLSLC